MDWHRHRTLTLSGSDPHSRGFVPTLTLVGLATAVFVVNVFASYLRSLETFAHELESPADAPQTWNLGTWDAIKYRVAFRWIVQGTWDLLPVRSPETFYATYLGWSYVCFVGAILSIRAMLRTTGHDERDAMLGTLLALTAPPLLFVYLSPVHTREDPLAYCVVALAFSLAARRREVWLAVVLAFGVACRETTAIVGLAYLVGSGRPWSCRIAVLMPAAVVLGLVRLAMGPNTEDTPFGGLEFNLQHPWQSLGFLGLVFGWMWVPCFAARRALAGRSRGIASTFPIVLVAILLAHGVFGRLREIRISFIVFPWVLPLVLHWLAGHRGAIASAWRSRPIKAAAIGCGLALAAIWIVALPRWAHWGALFGLHSAIAIVIVGALGRSHSPEDHPVTASAGAFTPNRGAASNRSRSAC